MVVIQESDKKSYDSDQVSSVANESDDKEVPEVVNEYGLDDESMNHVSENITARNAELNATIQIIPTEQAEANITVRRRNGGRQRCTSLK